VTEIRAIGLALAVTAALSFAAAAGPSRNDEREQTEQRNWQSRHLVVVQDVENARHRYRAASAEYQQMRHRRRMRGERKAQVIAELDAAREAVEEAERALAEFDAEARRAGVPPGWLRAAPKAPIEPGPASANAP
jgi:nucleotide-binding universal stress UspA family protein